MYVYISATDGHCYNLRKQISPGQYRGSTISVINPLSCNNTLFSSLSLAISASLTQTRLTYWPKTIYSSPIFRFSVRFCPSKSCCTCSIGCGRPSVPTTHGSIRPFLFKTKLLALYLWWLGWTTFQIKRNIRIN